MNREIVRMNLVGLGPERRKKIKNIAEKTIRTFDGAPEHVASFNEACELWGIIIDIELAETVIVVESPE